MSRIDNGTPDFGDDADGGIIGATANHGLRHLAVQPIANFLQRGNVTIKASIDERVGQGCELLALLRIILGAQNRDADSIAPRFICPLISGFFSSRQVQPLTR
jgi:hypothetical protein